MVLVSRVNGDTNDTMASTIGGVSRRMTLVVWMKGPNASLFQVGLVALAKAGLWTRDKDVVVKVWRRVGFCFEALSTC